VVTVWWRCRKALHATLSGSTPFDMAVSEWATPRRDNQVPAWTGAATSQERTGPKPLTGERGRETTHRPTTSAETLRKATNGAGSISRGCAGTLLNIHAGKPCRIATGRCYWSHWQAEESAVLGLQRYARMAGVDLVDVAERISGFR
jgi:hypothetical protein